MTNLRLDTNDAQFSMFADHYKNQNSDRTFSHLNNDRQSRYSDSFRPRSNLTNSHVTDAANNIDFFNDTHREKDQRAGGLSFLNDVRNERLFGSAAHDAQYQTVDPNSFDFNNLRSHNQGTSVWNQEPTSSLYPQLSTFNSNHLSASAPTGFDPMTPQKNTAVDINNPPEIKRNLNFGSRSKYGLYDSNSRPTSSSAQNVLDPRKNTVPPNVYNDTRIPGVIDFSYTQPLSQATPIKRKPDYDPSLLAYNKPNQNETYNPYARNINLRQRHPKSYSSNFQKNHITNNSKFDYSTDYRTNPKSDRAESMVSDYTEASKFMQSILPTEFPGKLPKEYKNAPEPLKTGNYSLGYSMESPTKGLNPMSIPQNKLIPEMAHVNDDFIERYRMLMNLEQSNAKTRTKANSNIPNSYPLSGNTKLDTNKKENRGILHTLFGNTNNDEDLIISDKNKRSKMVNQEVQTDSPPDLEKFKLTRELLETQAELFESRKALSSALALTSSPSQSKINKEQALQIEQAMNEQYQDQKKKFRHQQKLLEEQYTKRLEKLGKMLEMAKVKNSELESQNEQIAKDLKEMEKSHDMLHDYAYKKDKECEEIKEKCGKSIKAYTHFLNLYLAGNLPKPKFVSSEDAAKYQRNKASYSDRLGDRIVVDEKEFNKISSNLSKLATDVELYADEKLRRTKDLENFKDAIREMEKDSEKEREYYENEMAKMNYALDDERGLQKEEYVVVVRQLNRKLEQCKEIYGKEIRQLKEDIEAKNRHIKLIEEKNVLRTNNLGHLHDPIATENGTGATSSISDKNDDKFAARSSLNRTKSWGYLNNSPKLNDTEKVAPRSNYKPSRTLDLSDLRSKAQPGSDYRPRSTFLLDTTERPVNKYSEFMDKPLKSSQLGTRFFGDKDKSLRSTMQTPAFNMLSSTSTISILNEHDHEPIYSSKKNSETRPFSSSSTYVSDAKKIDAVLDQLNQRLVLLGLSTSFRSFDSVVEDIKQRDSEMRNTILDFRSLIYKAPKISSHLKQMNEVFDDIKYLLDEIPELMAKADEFEQQMKNSALLASSKESLRKVHGQILGHLNSASLKLSNIYITALSKAD